VFESGPSPGSICLPHSSAAQELLCVAFGPLFFLALLAPGALAANLRAPDDDCPSLASSFFAFSSVFYAAVYFLVDVMLERVLGVAPPRWAWAAVSAAGTIALAAANRNRMRLLATRLRAALPGILCFLVLLELSTAILTFDQLLPLTNYQFTTIAGPKTFGWIYAHDNYFQFVNGRAIAEGEPFSKYYGHAALTYPVTSREMLPGVVYAVFRHLLPRALSDSYLLYTLLGTCFDLMIVFPILELARRRLSLRDALLLLAACFGTSFFIVNAYYTWFKFAGAALFLSGLLALLKDRSSNRDWGWAGFYWGVATNMHAGAALGIPVFFFWLTWERWSAERSRARALAGSALLVVLFTALNLPWNLVKMHYIREDNVLFEEHFLEDTHDPKGVFASVKDFFAAHPLASQLRFRSARVAEIPRLREIRDELRGRRSLGELALAWSRMESRYVLPLFYPLLLLVIVGAAVRRWKRERLPWASEQRMLLAGSAATFLLLQFASYGRTPFDITWQQPLAVLVLAYIVLAERILQGPRLVRAAFLCWVAVSWVRILGVLFFVKVTWTV
jgi:hypothetical protein